MFLLLKYFCNQNNTIRCFNPFHASIVAFKDVWHCWWTAMKSFQLRCIFGLIPKIVSATFAVWIFIHILIDTRSKKIHYSLWQSWDIFHNFVEFELIIHKEKKTSFEKLFWIILLRVNFQNLNLNPYLKNLQQLWGLLINPKATFVNKCKLTWKQNENLF